MRIAILHDDFPPHHEGGSGVIAYHLARGYARDGHVVRVITTVRASADAGKMSMDGFEVIRLHAEYPDRWRAYLSLYNPRIASAVGQLLKEFSPDVVHVHNVHTYLSFRSLVHARKYARAVFLTAHDAMMVCDGKLPSATRDSGWPGPIRESEWEQFRRQKLRYNPLRTRIIRRIVRRNVDRVVAVSNALAQALAVGGVPNLSVIHNGIDPDDWKEPEGVETFKRRYGIHDAAILFGGRLSAPKGAYALSNALPLIARRVPSVQMLVIGKKNTVAERMLAQLGENASRVVFTGWIDGTDLRRAYYASSLVAVPSLYLDPFPTVNLEAFSCRKPVVATCFGGSPEIVEDGESGAVLNPLNTEELAARTSDILSDKKKQAAFGAAGFSRVARSFKLEEQVRAYERLFENALAGRGS